MTRPTADDLRELSRRSRRTHGAALVAVVGSLLFVPAQLALGAWLSTTWLALAAVVLGGALLLRFAFVAGEERGAYRRLFRELRAARGVAVKEMEKTPPEAAPASGLKA